MPIDLSTVNWMFVTLMAVFAFIAALLGNLIAFRNLFVGSILTGLLFAGMFVVWNYYPHPTIPLPIVTSYTSPS
jgi:hypothetical protein